MFASKGTILMCADSSKFKISWLDLPNMGSESFQEPQIIIEIM